MRLAEVQKHRLTKGFKTMHFDQLVNDATRPASGTRLVMVIQIGARILLMCCF